MDNLILIASAFVTSVISGILGMAGGFLLMAVMANFFPPAIVIPLHGIVQLSSNSFRFLLNFKHIKWEIVIAFSIGSFLGAATGSRFLADVPENLFRLGLAAFILFFTWMPKMDRAPQIPYKFFWVGLGGSFLSLFVGVIGPIVAPFYLREGLKKESLVSTKAVNQATNHLFKIAVYFWIGFEVTPYLDLLLGMLIAVFFGNLLGKFLLGKISEGNFRFFFKVIVSVLAIRVAWLSF